MEKTPSFREAVAELARLESALLDLANSTSPEWKHELLRLRRLFQAQITFLAQLVGQSALTSEQPELARRFRDTFSKMRTTLALHQANWPAVQIDRENVAYRNSVKAVREANQTFKAVAQEITRYVDAEPPST